MEMLPAWLKHIFYFLYLIYDSVGVKIKPDYTIATSTNWYQEKKFCKKRKDKKHMCYLKIIKWHVCRAKIDTLTELPDLKCNKTLLAM